MPDIFTYTDYRTFLADYYCHHKAENPAFSYQLLSDKAGFSNRGFIFNVITGKKNLSRSSAVKLSQALRLTAREADYFDNLVSFNQAKNLRERNYFFDKINAIKSNRQGSAAVRETRKEQYEFYAAWYISVVRSLIDMHRFKDDYQWLAKNVYPPIKPKEAKKAVLLLEKLGMIRKQKDGYYKVADKTITAGKEIMQLGLLNFQVQTTELAKKALQELPKDRRNISGLTLGISKKTYDSICAEIETFQSRLLAMAEADNEADNVYQLNFHFFPVSNVKP
ncbi:MAG: TIGR02147 family protein [Chitinispirillaceae bacterium]|jgi:uncharacterized protein (TIGR02147 family)